MFSGVRQAITWFLDGLVEILAAVAGRMRRRGRLRLIRVDDGYAIEQPDGRRQPQHIHLEHAGGTTRLAPVDAAARLKDHEIELVLPADELLVRTLDPMPAESRPYVDGIVRHQLERLAPWRSDDILHTYQIAQAGAKNDRLVITIAATARSIHGRLIAALAALGPRELRLVYQGVPQMDGDVAIPVDNNASGIARHQQLRRVVVMALAIILFVSGAGFGFLAYTWHQASETLATAEASVSDLRQRLAAGRSQTPAGERDLNAILARRKATPAVVLAMDALADALSDDTWLTELRVADGRMRITGISRNVAELVPQIASAPGFADATFFAPTTRLPGGQGDRFHLEMRLVPAARKSP